MDYLHVLLFILVIFYCVNCDHLTRRQTNRGRIPFNESRRSQLSLGRGGGFSRQIERLQNSNQKSLEQRRRELDTLTRRNLILQRELLNLRRQKMRESIRLDSRRGNLNMNIIPRSRQEMIIRRHRNMNILANRRRNFGRRVHSNLRANGGMRNNDNIIPNLFERHSIVPRSRSLNLDLITEGNIRKKLFVSTMPPVLFNGFPHKKPRHIQRESIVRNFARRISDDTTDNRHRSLFHVPVVASTPPPNRQTLDLHALLSNVVSNHKHRDIPVTETADSPVTIPNPSHITKPSVNIDDIITAMLLKGEILVQNNEQLAPAQSQIVVPNIMIMPTPPIPLLATFPPTIPPTPSALDKAIHFKILEELGFDLSTDTPELPEGAAQTMKPKPKPKPKRKPVKKTKIIMGKSAPQKIGKNKNPKPKHRTIKPKDKKHKIVPTTLSPIKIFFSNDGISTNTPIQKIPKTGTISHQGSIPMLITPLGNFTLELASNTTNNGFVIA